MINTLNRAGFSVQYPIALDKSRFVEIPDVVLTNSTYLQLIGLMCTHLNLVFTFEKNGSVTIADTEVKGWVEHESFEALPPNEVVAMKPFKVGNWAERNNG